MEEAYTNRKPIAARKRASAAACVRRANAFEAKGLYDQAVESIKKAIELAPENPNHRIHLANLYRAQRKFRSAIAAMRRAVELDPRNTVAQESLLQIYLEVGRYDDAIADGKKLLRRYPRNLYVRDILGVAYLKKGLLDEALSVTDELIKLDPMDATNHFKKAVLFQQKGDFMRSMRRIPIAPNHKPRLRRPCLSRAAVPRPRNRSPIPRL